MSFYNTGIKTNLILASLSKVSSLLASFLIIPILLKGLGLEDYGTWVTLSSVAAWLLFFDFGLGNSFKNIVATGNKVMIIKTYSVALSLYVYVSIFLAFCFLGFIVISNGSLQNQAAIMLLYLPLCLLFPLTLFSFGVQGLRLVGVNALVDTLRVFIWLVFAVLYIYFFKSKQLYVLSLIFVFANLTPQILQFIIFKKNCGFPLKLNLINPLLIIKEDSFKLAIKFFIIQISSLVSFNLGNFLIYNYFGSADVALYDLFNKVFVAGLSIFNMTIAVLWPEITKAYVNNNLKLCHRLYKKILAIAFIFSLGVLLVATNFDLFLQLLTLDNILVIDTGLLWCIAMLTILQAIAYCGAVVLNATNNLRLQIHISIASIIFIYPIFIILFNLGFGVMSYPLATGILVFLAAILYNVMEPRILKVNYVD